MKVAFILVAFLAYSYGAALPGELDLVMDQVQQFLINPEPLAEAAGLRVRRSISGEWDKEFELFALGLTFKLKYIDPANPMKGGRAHIKFPVQRFIKAASFDDVELDIDFKGGEAIDGLFELTTKYKFVQKFMLHADRTHEGNFMIYRKFEGGLWKTHMTLNNANWDPKPFMEFTLESDRLTKLYWTYKYDSDNTWDFKLDRVPGAKQTLVFTVNGHPYTIEGTFNKAQKKVNLKFQCPEHTYTLDFQLATGDHYGITVTGDVDGPVEARALIKKDYTDAEFVVKHKTTNYAFIKMKGQAVLKGLVPQSFTYQAKYTIMDGMIGDGKAKVKYDGTTPAKTLKLSFVPKTGLDLHLEYRLTQTSKGFDLYEEHTRNGKSYYKHESQNTWINSADKFEMGSIYTETVIPESFVYSVYCWMGYCHKEMHGNFKVSYDKVSRNFLLGKMLYEEEMHLDGKKVWDAKFDTTKTPYTFKWFAPNDPYLSTQKIFGMDQVEATAKHTVGKELVMETNLSGMKMTIRRKPDYFVEFIKDGQTMLKVTANVTPAAYTLDMVTKFYLMSDTLFHQVFCSYGSGCFNERDGHIKIFVDRVNKNTLLNKFSVEAVVKKDQTTVLEWNVDTVKAPHVFRMHAPYFLPKVLGDTTRHTIEGTVQTGPDSLEFISNIPEVKTFKVSKNGIKHKVELNGEELVVVDYKKGSKQISQTTVLPSGESVTTSLMWTTANAKKNKIILKVTAPQRNLDATFDWDLPAGVVKMVWKAENPHWGQYEITRDGRWSFNANKVLVNWTGKSTFTKGLLAAFSPIDTNMQLDLNKKTWVLDADVTKVIGGKPYGFILNGSLFKILSGRP